MIEDISFSKLLVILVIALLFFGARRLPELAGSLGKSIREFKKGMQDNQDETKKENQHPPDGTPKGDGTTTHTS